MTQIPDQAALALNANVARSTYGVDGSGDRRHPVRRFQHVCAPFQGEVERAAYLSPQIHADKI
jgi:hypothetical protein